LQDIPFGELELRLLVLSGSRVVPSLIEYLTPADVEVTSTDSFEKAVQQLEGAAPDGLVVDVGHSQTPWSQLESLCAQHSPPVPVLFESALYSTARAAGVDHLGPSSSFLGAPYDLLRLREEIHHLLGEMESALH
jgi:DNA-binding NtrC family response regulator